MSNSIKKNQNVSDSLFTRPNILLVSVEELKRFPRFTCGQRSRRSLWPKGMSSQGQPTWKCWKDQLSFNTVSMRSSSLVQSIILDEHSFGKKWSKTLPQAKIVKLEHWDSWRREVVAQGQQPKILCPVVNWKNMAEMPRPKKMTILHFNDVYNVEPRAKESVFFSVVVEVDFFCCGSCWEESSILLSFLVPSPRSSENRNLWVALPALWPGSRSWRCQCFPTFSRMRSEGSRFTWGSGGEAVFAKSCVCDRNRRQPSATVCGVAVRLSTVASASEGVQKLCQIESCRRSYMGLCRGGVCESDLCRRSYIGVCRGGVCESDLWRGSYIGVCRGGVSVSDLWRHVILVFAEEVSVWVICGTAVILVFAEEVSVRVIWVAAVILVSAEEVSVRVIRVAAVILVSAEEVSVRVICVAAVIMVFAQDVSVRLICGAEECLTRVSS